MAEPKASPEADPRDRVKELTRELFALAPSDAAAQIRCMRERGEVWYQLCDFRMAAQDFATAGKLAEEKKIPAEAARCLLRESSCWTEIGKPDDAKRTAAKALALGRDAPGSGVLEEALVRLGAVHRRVGDFRQAELCVSEAVDRLKRGKDRAATASAIHGLGLLYWEQGKHAGADAAERESLAIQKSLGNEYGVALSLTNLAATHFERGLYAESLRMAGEALEISRRLSLPRIEPIALTALGSNWADIGEFEQARRMNTDALGIHRRQGSKRSSAISLYNLGSEIALPAGRLDEAGRLLDEALTLARETQSPIHQAMVLTAQAELGLARKEPEGRVRMLAQQAIGLAREAAHTETLALAASVLMRCDVGGESARHAASALAAAASCTRPLVRIRVLLDVLDASARSKEIAAAIGPLSDLQARLDRDVSALDAGLGPEHAQTFRQKHPVGCRLALRKRG